MIALKVSMEKLELLLSQLNYQEIEFFHYDQPNHIYYLDAVLDTYYRIQCWQFEDGTVELHDTTFDCENYVKIAKAKMVSGKWVVSYN